MGGYVNYHFTGDERYGEGPYDYCHHCNGPFASASQGNPMHKLLGDSISNDCSKLKYETYTMEWREKFARVWYNGKLVSEWNADTWLDHCRSNTATSLPWYFNSIEWVRHPLFMALTACVMENKPPGVWPAVDTSPSYFVLDSVRVCE